METYFNPNPRRYPTRHDVVKIVEKWGDDVCPDYSLAGIRNTTSSRFQAGFYNPVTHEVLHVDLDLYPNQHKDYPGWHVRNPRIVRLAVQELRHDVEVYTPTLETLMMAFPNDRIVHIDNEDDEWPAFGWAVLGTDGFKAFIQNPRDENELQEYWKNPDLPYATLVIDPFILDRLKQDMWDHTMHNVRLGYDGAY